MGINKYQVADEQYDGIWYKYYSYPTLDAEDDVATALWGDEWRMPTIDEWRELDQNTTKEWTDNYFDTGVCGYILTSTKPGYENAYIFLPAGENNLYSSLCDYWSSSINEGCSFRYKGLSFWDNFYMRYEGLSVRPVCPAAKP